MVGPKNLLFYGPFKSLKNLSPFAIIFFCQIFTKHNLYFNRIFLIKCTWKMYHGSLCSHLTNMAWTHHREYLIRSSAVFLYVRIHAICAKKCLYQQLPKGISYSQEHHETDGHICLWYNVFTVSMKDDQEFLKMWLLSILMVSMIFSESSIAFYFFLFEKIILLITFLTNPRLFLLFPFLFYLLTFTPKKSMCSYLKSTQCTYCCQYLIWQRAVCRSRSSV